ncbi:MAG TPA: chloride channel protein [Ktedonobacterales bacterium]|nr:chloride channel protein [Ktedonobacterales bacterium]
MRQEKRSARANASTALYAPQRLGDFTVDRRVLIISALAIVVGVIGAGIAAVLMAAIGLITNAVYYHRLSTALVSPAHMTLGWWSVPIPIIGGLIIGLMARYGSERIRGHGIPEAMETILVGGSKVEPRLAILKPISAAISIGTGGPFGAEGPIILTGGAFGSVIGQFFRLTAAERKTLLVAGAAAGMAATFNAPVAAVLLAIEILVFEWKPRSLVPIALASATATLIRRRFISDRLLFPEQHYPSLGVTGLLAALVAGVLAGGIAYLLTLGVYGAEDFFRKLPVHWMWWPAIGGVVVGVVGVFFPRALGVGYDSIGLELAGSFSLQLLVGLMIAKAVIWCIALGSGTSGGILAPILLVGGALGGLEGAIFPGHSLGLWALVGMAAALAGAARTPLTGVIFAVELTGAFNALLPLLIACVIAYLFSTLVLRRSILTEKVARRGFHVSHEYAVDPLEALKVGEVMRTQVTTVGPTLSLATLRARLATRPQLREQRLYPVMDEETRLIGVISQTDALVEVAEATTAQASSDGAASPAQNGHASVGASADGAHTPPADNATVADVMRCEIVVAYPDETLRTVAARMVTTESWRLPVVARNNQQRLLGFISQRELLRSRGRLLEEERHRERVLSLNEPRRLLGGGAPVTGNEEDEAAELPSTILVPIVADDATPTPTEPVGVPDQV